MLEESSTRAIGTYVEKILFCHNVVGAVRFLVPQTKVSEVEIAMDEIQEDMDEIQVDMEEIQEDTGINVLVFIILVQK